MHIDICTQLSSSAKRQTDCERFLFTARAAGDNTGPVGIVEYDLLDNRADGEISKDRRPSWSVINGETAADMHLLSVDRVGEERVQDQVVEHYRLQSLLKLGPIDLETEKQRKARRPYFIAPLKR